MTHEYGHSVGMLDETDPVNKHIMYRETPRDYNGNGQFFYDPNWINDYSTSSKNQTVARDQ